MTGIVNMEEKYENLSIDYKNKEEKEKIFNINENAISKFKISPNVFIKPLKPGSGTISFEFNIHDRTIGSYFEFIIKNLELKII